jgi:hypothetical protein
LDGQVTSVVAKPAAKSTQQLPDNRVMVVNEQTSENTSSVNGIATTKLESSGAEQTSGAEGNAQPTIADRLVNVTLSINGAQRGNVSLEAGSNHCEVLRQALANGQIFSLDIGSEQYGQDFVYAIDGIGSRDDKSGGWRYVVNGKYPPLGCSKVSVMGGISINWQYVKG